VATSSSADEIVGPETPEHEHPLDAAQAQLDSFTGQIRNLPAGAALPIDVGFALKLGLGLCSAVVGVGRELQAIRAAIEPPPAGTEQPPPALLEELPSIVWGCVSNAPGGTTQAADAAAELVRERFGLPALEGEAPA